MWTGAQQFLSRLLCSCISQGAVPKQPQRVFFSLWSSKSALRQVHPLTTHYAYMQLLIVCCRSGRGQVNKSKSDLCVSQPSSPCFIFSSSKYTVVGGGEDCSHSPLHASSTSLLIISMHMGLIKEYCILYPSLVCMHEGSQTVCSCHKLD